MRVLALIRSVAQVGGCRMARQDRAREQDKGAIVMTETGDSMPKTPADADDGVTGHDGAIGHAAPRPDGGDANNAGANLSNWLVTPQSRWAFRNVPALIDSVVIRNDPRDVAPLMPAPTRLAGSVVRTLFLKATATDAIVVVHNGHIVFEWYDNGNDQQTRHILMSGTKSIVGLIIEILGSTGAMDLDALVSTYVPEIAQTGYGGATVRELLDMRAGVRLDERQERIYREAVGWEPAPHGETRERLAGFLAHLPGPPATHGGPFRYVSANTDLLGWAVERATGECVASLMSKLLWKPMGAEQDASITVDGGGLARCTGGLCATARDVARLGQVLVDGGRRGDRQIVPEACLDSIATGGDARAWRDGEWGKAFSLLSKNMRYRSGWYAIDDEPTLLFAMGVHGQNLFVDRAHKIVIAKFSSWGRPTDYVALGLTHLAVRRMQRSLIAKERKNARTKRASG